MADVAPNQSNVVPVSADEILPGGDEFEGQDLDALFAQAEDSILPRQDPAAEVPDEQLHFEQQINDALERRTAPLEQSVQPEQPSEPSGNGGVVPDDSQLDEMSLDELREAFVQLQQTNEELKSAHDRSLQRLGDQANSIDELVAAKVQEYMADKDVQEASNPYRGMSDDEKISALLKEEYPDVDPEDPSWRSIARANMSMASQVAQIVKGQVDSLREELKADKASRTEQDVMQELGFTITDDNKEKLYDEYPELRMVKNVKRRVAMMKGLASEHGWLRKPTLRRDPASHVGTGSGSGSRAYESKSRVLSQDYDAALANAKNVDELHETAGRMLDGILTGRIKTR